MSGLRFKRPVGANADVKELEYVIALHQTSEDTRNNATVSSGDILALLRSRYSLTITHKEAIVVVRSLGGGDTVADDPAPKTSSAIANTTQKSKELVGNALSKLSNPFANHNNSRHSENNDENVADSDHEVVGSDTGTKKNTKKPKFSSETTSNMVSRLHHMHGKHQQGHEEVDDHTIRVLKEDIVAHLRAKVMRKAKSSRFQAQRRGFASSSIEENDEDDTSTSTIEIEFVDTKEQSEQEQSSMNTQNEKDAHSGCIELDDDGIAIFAETEYTSTEEFRLSQVMRASGEPTLFIVEDEEKEEEDREHLPEYLDMVQILSTLMTTKFAQIAYRAKNEDRKQRKNPQSAYEEDPSSLAPDEEESPEPPKEPRLATRLANRFIQYGRRQLQITDDEPDPFTPHDVIELGLNALLKNIVPSEGGDGSLVLDETLVQLLLLCHGEVERANNEELVHEMVTAAQSSSGLFDQEALINAISMDLLECYDPKCLDHDTSFFFDVFGVAQPSVDTKLKSEEDEEDECKLDVEKGSQVKHGTESPKSLQEEGPAPDITEESEKHSWFARCCASLFPVFTKLKRGQYSFSTAFLGIDMVVDNSASILVHILIWVAYILTAVIYGGLLTRAPDVRDDCSSNEYWCKIADTVYSWLIIALMLIALGLFFVLPASVGNNPSDQTPQRTLGACFWVLLNSLGPFLAILFLDKSNVDNPDVQKMLQNPVYDGVQILTLSVGLFLGFLYFLQGVVLVMVSTDHPHLLPRPVQSLLALASWKAEVRVYQAAKYKLEKFLLNALKLHGVHPEEAETKQAMEKQNPNFSISKKLALTETADRTSRHFVLYGETQEEVGGLFWTFWRLCDGHLFRKEGLWLNTRLLVIQITQVAVAITLSITMFIVAKRAADAADRYIASLDPDLPSWVIDIFPTGAMIEAALIPATFISCAFMFFLIIVYIPSSFATILKYRGKLLPSLGADKFKRFRSNVDLTYMNTANGIYGMVGAGALFYLAVGITILLFLWPYSQDIMWMLVAWSVGLAITVGIKMIVTQCCRKIQYRAYYRIRPGAARVTSLALECWHIGLAGSVLLARVCQFLLAAVFWVGRIDTPFLSEEVVAFGYGFDMVPTHYHKDLLVHEAHRHPYIEQLCQMYLMKLRHGDKFISDAGAAWRQLLILALFPWLTKRRVFKNERRIHAEHEAEEAEEMEEKENDPRIGMKEMRGNAAEVTYAVGDEVYGIGHELYGAGEDIFGQGAKAVSKGSNPVN